MRASILILLFFVLFVTKTSAQSYRITGGGYPGTSGFSVKTVSVSTGSGGSSFIVSSRPSGSFSITFSPPSGSGYSDCTLSGTIPSGSCSGSGSGTATPCGGSGTSWGINVSIEAIIAIESGTSASGDYCEDDNITINGTSGFPDYSWEYRVNTGGTWQSFSPGSTASVSFGMQTVFGASYTSYYNQPIYFRYKVGCATSAAVGPYEFGPTRPFVASAIVEDPKCIDSSDGIIKITGLTRSLIGSESLSYTVTTLTDVFVAKKSNVTQVPTVANPIVIDGADLLVAPSGIGAGSFRILVESTESLCGDVEYFLLDEIGLPDQVEFEFETAKPTCHENTTGNSSNGSITITASGGSGTGYEYSKDNGATFQSGDVFTGLTPGVYKVIIRDSHDCPSEAQNATILAATDISITSAAVTSDYNGRDINCVGSADGIITVNATGTGTLTFSRNDADFYSGNVLTGFGVGSHTITVKDANGCTKKTSAVPIANPPALSAGATAQQPSCFGLPDGSITASGSGGTITDDEPFMFSVNGSSFREDPAFLNFSAGEDYVVTVRDANDCEASTTIDVGQPAEIIVSVETDPVVCFGGTTGSLTITATMGVGDYRYSLDGTTFQESNTFAALTADTYNVVVLDQEGDGCMATGSATVGTNSPILGPISIASAVTCAGFLNGELDLAPSGGVGPYFFAWSNSESTEDISGLGAGNYSVLVTDSEGCEKTFTQTLTEPLPLAVTGTTSDFHGRGVRCFGSSDGSIDITASNGNGGYTYAWSSGQNSEDLADVVAGSYTVTVTDIEGCTETLSLSLTQPDVLELTITDQEDITCFGGNNGSISVEAEGGTNLLYEFTIDNGNTWQEGLTFSSLSVGEYDIILRDINGCTDTGEVSLSSPDDLILSVDDVTQTTCGESNGAATVSASGSVPDYTFAWYTSDNDDDVLANGVTIGSLPAGIYRVTVTDDHHCTKEQTVIISSSNGPVISVDNILPVTCFGDTDGSATISITLGLAPYSVAWPDGQTTLTASGLAGKNHIVQVTDETGCKVFEVVPVPSPEPLTIDLIGKKDPTCFKYSDGSIEVLGKGGNGDLTYLWNTGGSSVLLDQLSEGTYSVSLRDRKGCETSASYLLTDPAQFTINLGDDKTICVGQQATIGVLLANTTFVWEGPADFQSSSGQVTVVQAGTYGLTATNAAGCIGTDEITITASSDLLKADFLMVTQAFVADTIFVIDISWPLPQSIEWKLPEDASVFHAGQDYVSMSFEEPGTYTINMTARLAQCVSIFTQDIEILESENDNSGGRQKSEALIRTVEVYPNPAVYTLNVDINLNETHSAVVELYHLLTNRKEFTEKLDHSSEYHTTLNLDRLQSGHYVVIVKAGDEIRSVKLIKL